MVDGDAPGNKVQAIAETKLQIDLSLSPRLTGFIRPWLLIDALDTDLLRYEPLDGYLEYRRETWDVRAGQFVESWGMADTFNPVDVLNRRDPASDFFDPEVLGEVGVKLRYVTDLGEIIDEFGVSLYAMPLWRKTPFPTKSSRFGISADVATIRDDLSERPDLDDAVFAAIRVEHTLTTGPVNADVQYIVARGPDRTPVFAFSPNMDGGIDLIPQYHGSWVSGFGVRAVPNNETLSLYSFKGEIAHKRPFKLPSVEATVADPYTQYAVGLERSIAEPFSSNDLLTVIAEYIGEFGASDQPSELRLFDSHAAVALRWARNDFAKMTADARLIIDVTSAELIGELVLESALRSVHDDLRLQLSGRIVRRSSAEPSVLSLLPNNSSTLGRLQFDF